MRWIVGFVLIVIAVALCISYYHRQKLEADWTRWTKEKSALAEFETPTGPSTKPPVLHLRAGISASPKALAALIRDDPMYKQSLAMGRAVNNWDDLRGCLKIARSFVLKWHLYDYDRDPLYHEVERLGGASRDWYQHIDEADYDNAKRGLEGLLQDISTVTLPAITSKYTRPLEVTLKDFKLWAHDTGFTRVITAPLVMARDRGFKILRVPGLVLTTFRMPYKGANGTSFYGPDYPYIAITTNSNGSILTVTFCFELEWKYISEAPMKAKPKDDRALVLRVQHALANLPGWSEGLMSLSLQDEQVSQLNSCFQRLTKAESDKLIQSNAVVWVLSGITPDMRVELWFDGKTGKVTYNWDDEALRELVKEAMSSK